MKQLLLTLLIVAIFVSGNAQNFIVTKTGKLTNDEHVFKKPERTSAEATTDVYTASFTFPGVKIIDKSHKGKSYQFLKIQGTGQTTQPGAPALPSFYDQVLAPKNTKAKISINKTTYTELNGFMLHPALKPAKDTYGATPPEWEMDKTIYTKNAFYPENPVSIYATQDLRGFPIVMVQVNPIQFNPVTGKIRVHSELSYTIHFNDGDKSSINTLEAENSPTFLTNLRASVTNPQMVPRVSKAKAKEGEYNYLLITPNAYKAAADTLAQWKRQLGYTVEVIAEQAWSAAMVKDAIHSRYSEWTVKPDYFLILGDHGGNNPVPGEMFPAPDNDGYYATDLYFACMGGTYDFRPEMAHGRISVSTPEEAISVVKKIVNYERYPVNNAEFYGKALTCAQFQDVADAEAPDGYAARRFAHTSEDIRDYTIGQGYDVDRIYYTDNSNTPTNYNSGYYSDGQAIPTELLRSNGFAWNGNSNQIKNAINDGRLFVFHRDHGYSGGTGWSNPRFVTSSISSLSNGEMLPIVFSINCHTGEFSLNKCFSEAFLRHEGGGAVGVFGASYYSYSGYNDGLSAGMIDAIWSNPGLTPNFGYGGAYNPPASTANNIRTMGDVMNQGLTRMEQIWGVSEYTNRLFHYFGDPAMRIWTENPHANVISADYPSSLSCNENTFELTNCNTENAMVTLVHDGQLLGVTTTQDGSATINYELTSGYPYATLTISKENHAPYIQKVMLEGTCNFSPIVIAQHAEVTSQGKALLHGEIIEAPTGTISESGIIYGTSANLTTDSPEAIVLQTIPTVTTGEFAVTSNYFNPSTRYYYRAYAINENGTGYSEVKSFESQCEGIDKFAYALDFAERILPPCWNIDDYSGTDQSWTFNNPGSRTFGSTTGDNGFIIVDSDFHGGTGSQNTHFTSPTFDFSIYGGVTLNFEHYYRHSTSSSAELFYSTNNGSSWTVIEEWTATLGSFATPEQFSVNLTEELAGEEQVRFRWSYTGDNDYYWIIDDIEITASDFKRYEVYYNSAILQLGDTIFDYTPVNTGTDLPFSFTVNNIGDQPLSVENPTATHDNYGVVPFESSIVAPGESDAFDIVYTPAEAGSHNATISFGSDAPNLENFSFELFTNLAATYAGTINVVNAYGTPIENATVEISGHTTQTTDADGNATFATLASSQTHGFTVTHSNYQPFSGTIGITHQDEGKTIVLNGNAINITFNISNGSTQLNNALISLSSGGALSVNNGTATTEINGIQPITYQVTNYGYEDYSGEVNLTLNDTTIDVVMIQIGHQVDVYVTTSGVPVPNAAVSVQSGPVFHTNNEGVASVTGVQSGYYRSIAVEARGYQAFEDNTNISGDMEFNVSLTPNAYNMNIQVLRNNEPFEGASVTLDSEPSQTTNADGSVQFAELNAHPSRTLLISKEGMEPISRTINFNADTTLTYHMQLEGIGEHADGMQLYPNPASTSLTIMHESEILQSIIVYTGTGKKVVQTHPRGVKTMHLDVSHLPEGVYHISITTEVHTYRKKIIIR